MPQIPYRYDDLAYGLGYIYRSDEFTSPSTSAVADQPHYGAVIKVYDLGGVKLAEYSTDAADPRACAASFDLLPTGPGRIELDVPDAGDLDHEIRVDVHLLGRARPIYSGLLQQVPDPATTDWPLSFGGFGPVAVLDRYLVTATYASKTVHAVADALAKELETRSGGRVVYSSSKIVQTPTSLYALQEIRFRYISMKKAFQQLAGLAGGFEFGVDADREIFFRPADTSIEDASRLWVGEHCKSFVYRPDSSGIANVLYIKHGQRGAAGDNYLPEPLTDTASIALYGRREAVVTAPSVFSATDAYRWGSVELARRAGPVGRASVDGIILSSDYTRDPIRCSGYARITARNGAAFTLPKAKVTYKIGGSGIDVGVQLGELEPTPGTLLAELEQHQAIEDLLAQQNLTQIAI